jgi:glycine/D-amino acid oxidase-like deaminating enzyme/nitrite reductase/ring-hydroxylating ferredoxin subunit
MHREGKKYFDKPPESYWISSTPQSEYPALNEDISVDIAIIGGGIAGITCAYLLSIEGFKTAILEADCILMGTTGHTTAKVTSQHELIYYKIQTQLGKELAKQYADANDAAIRFIEKTAREKQIDCDFVHQAAFVYTQQENNIDKIRNEVKTASDLGIKASYTEDIPLHFPIKAAVRFDGQAQFHPRKFLLALAKEVTHKGNTIYEQSRVIDIEKNGKYILKTGQERKVKADKVIIASHYPFLNKPGMYFTRIYVERSYVIAIKAAEAYPGGMYINAEDPVHSLRSQMTEEGELILLGGGRHKTGQGEDTSAHYEALIDFAHKHYRVEDIPYRWSTQDCMTLDGIPFTGQFQPDTPGLYIATGFGKWGMTNATASAMILRDLITHGVSPWKDVYNPSRKDILGSAGNFIVQNFNVAEKLVEGKISPVPRDLDLQKGEGKVIKIDGHRAGAYKDEAGNLHIVDTTCTHMGCELNWNSAEKSWDCPCHASRFSIDGEVIEGPAVRRLTSEEDTHTIRKLIKDEY